MDVVADLFTLQSAGVGLNAATVLLLYSIRRDLKDHKTVLANHWHWLEKLRRYAWPETFSQGDGKEPGRDAS